MYNDSAHEREHIEKIMQRNHTLEAILASLDCGVLCHTLDGSRIISVNQAAMSVLGYNSREEMEAEGFAKAGMMVPEEDRIKIWECISSLKNEGDSANVEYRMRHKDGRLLHIMEKVRLMRGDGGLFYHRLFLDKTAQKRKEKEEERHHIELLQALSIDFDSVYFFDLDTGTGFPIRTPPEAADYSGGFSLTWGMKFYTDNVVYEEDREMFWQRASAERFERELSEKDIYYVRYRTAEEGEIKYYQLKAVRVGDWKESRGIVVGFCCVDDETREEIRKNSLLEDALSQANRASKAKSAFLSNMSHDIRTPMNAIVGFTSLALNHIDEKDHVEEYLKKIRMSSSHLLSLINDILDMSRIESGKVHLEEAPCSLSEIMHELRNILIADANAKQIELHMDMGDVADEEIYCDKLRLNQVLLNLLGNAVKYTGAGGLVSFSVSERPGMFPGSAIYEFYVRDTGIGMSADFVERIFDPFERERNHTISKIQGTGLGMAITKNIVDMMNGSIEVKSEQDKGTEITVAFTFRLCSGDKGRAGVPEVKNRRLQAANDGSGTAHMPDMGRLLLAEDNELNQEIALTVLEEAGFAVDVADNGQIAVDMVSQSAPGYYQLILMDVQMPVMDGYEATTRIRGLEDEELSSIPIIAMTANAFEEDRRMAISCGMNGHIAKPIDMEKLLDMLDEILTVNEKEINLK